MTLETLILCPIIAILAWHLLPLLLPLAGLPLDISVKAISPTSVLADLWQVPWSRRLHSWCHLALTLMTLLAIWAQRSGCTRGATWRCPVNWRSCRALVGIRSRR